LEKNIVTHLSKLILADQLPDHSTVVVDSVNGKELTFKVIKDSENPKKKMKM